MKKAQVTFIVTNRSNRNVTLADLALNIPAYRTVNLLDSRHYSYTMEQLRKSAESGSIFKKQDKIYVHRTAPELPSGKYVNLMEAGAEKSVNKNAIIPSRERSTLVIKEEKYEELNISDEEFASENADTAEMDQKPLVVSSHKG